MRDGIPEPVHGTPPGLGPNELRLVPTEELLSEHDDPRPAIRGGPDETGGGGDVGGDVTGGDGGLGGGYAEGVGGRAKGGMGEFDHSGMRPPARPRR